MNFLTRCFATGLIGFVANIAFAAPTTQPIDDAIAHLGDPDPAIREQSAEALRQAGDEARSALELAAKSDDPEIAGRARQILRAGPKSSIANGNNQADNLPGVVRYRNATPQARRNIIAQLGYEKNGLRALARIWLTETNAELRTLIFERLLDQPSVTAAALLVDGNVASAELFLESAIDRKSDGSIQAYVAYSFMRSRIDDAIRRWRTRGGQTPADVWAEQVLAALNRVKGDAQEAIRHARASEDADTIQETLMWAGQWRELAVELRRDDRAGEEPHHLALRVGIDNLAGDKKELEDDLTRLSTAAKGTSAAEIAADTMLAIGRPSDAVKFLIDCQQLAAAYEILSDECKFDEAGELLAAHDKETTAEAMTIRATAADSLSQRGHKAEQGALVERLAGENAKLRIPRVYLLMGEACRKAGMMDKCWEYRQAAIESTNGDRRQYLTVSKAFSPNYSNVDWDGIWLAARRKSPDRSTKEIFPRLRGAFDQSMPLDELIEAIGGVDLRNEINRPYIELAWEAGRRTRAAQGEDAGKKLVTSFIGAASTGDLEMHLGDWAAEKKDWSEAARQYQAAWNKDRMRALPLYLLGWTMQQGGQIAEGQERIALAHLLPVGEDAARADLIHGLLIRGLDDAAVREADITIRISHSLSFHSEWSSRIVAERSEEKGDFAISAALWQRVLADSLASSYSYQTHAMFLHLPNIVSRLQARAKVAAGDVDGAKKLIDDSLQALPTDGETVLQLVMDFDKSGHRGEGDALFARGFGVLDDLCKKYPESSYRLNEAAWVAAKCHRELDKGLDYARRAVKIEPENPAAIDTLAEIYFQRGDFGKAVELETKCMDISPVNPVHLHQLERFIAVRDKAHVN